MDEVELDALLQAGIAAARAGRTDEARDLLLQVIAIDEQVEAAWLWLSGVVDDPAERRICLENVLTLNPGNERARAGLRWLADHGIVEAPLRPAEPLAPVASHPPEPARPVLRSPDSIPTPAPVSPESGAGQVMPKVEISPFGCPYCGGPIRSDESRCLSCARVTGIRQRKKRSGPWLGWLVALFLFLGATAWVEGAIVSRLAREEPLPAIVNETVARFFVGPVLIEPASPLQPGSDAMVSAADAAARGDAVALVNYFLGGLCGIVALGLALRSRVAYFAALILSGLLIVGALGGILVGLGGWLPAMVRVGGIVFSIYWLVDSSPAFEWEVRHYNADLDSDLRTDLDYYNRGLRYRDMGMWAKAAAHWKVAGQLAPGKTTYHVALARAYAQMGEREAALAVVEQAAAREPDDPALRAFRDSLALDAG